LWTRRRCGFVEADHAPTALQQDHSLGALLFLCAAPRDRREATVARINDGTKPSKNALISCACDVWRLQHFHLLMASFTSNTPQRQGRAIAAFEVRFRPAGLHGDACPLFCAQENP
jgi:hypothetical protein